MNAHCFGALKGLSAELMHPEVYVAFNETLRDILVGCGIFSRVGIRFG